MRIRPPARLSGRHRRQQRHPVFRIRPEGRALHPIMRPAGPAGLVVYNRKEDRALGEVTRFLVYNPCKRQRGGDTVEHYFERTECVAGVEDMRFQELMPDVLSWIELTRIDRFISMSNMKYDAIVGQGIEIVHRIAIPSDVKVEMDAKKAAGYFTDGEVLSADDLKETHGRSLEDY